MGISSVPGLCCLCSILSKSRAYWTSSFLSGTGNTTENTPVEKDRLKFTEHVPLLLYFVLMFFLISDMCQKFTVLKKKRVSFTNLTHLRVSCGPFRMYPRPTFGLLPTSWEPLTYRCLFPSLSPKEKVFLGSMASCDGPLKL